MDMQKAIEWQEAFKRTYRHMPEEVDDACDMAISALEKQIPKKPDRKTPEYGQYVGICGCGKPVYDCNNYCPECGQRIDWSEV